MHSPFSLIIFMFSGFTKTSALSKNYPRYLNYLWIARLVGVHYNRLSVRPLAVSENAHNSWTTWYILIEFCILIYFNFVQPLVCKTVTRMLGEKRRKLPKITKSMLSWKYAIVTIYRNFARAAGVHYTHCASPSNLFSTHSILFIFFENSVR